MRVEERERQKKREREERELGKEWKHTQDSIFPLTLQDELFMALSKFSHPNYFYDETINSDALIFFLSVFFFPVERKLSSEVVPELNGF